MELYMLFIPLRMESRFGHLFALSMKLFTVEQLLPAVPKAEIGIQSELQFLVLINTNSNMVFYIFEVKQLEKIIVI